MLYEFGALYRDIAHKRQLVITGLQSANELRRLHWHSTAHEAGDVANNKNAHQRNVIDIDRKFLSLDDTDRIVILGHEVQSDPAHRLRPNKIMIKSACNDSGRHRKNLIRGVETGIGVRSGLLLSGQDYPIRPLEATFDHLAYSGQVQDAFWIDL